MVHPLQKGHWLYCQGKFPALRWFSPLPFREGFYMCKTTFNGESTTAWNLIFWVVSHLAFAMKLRDVELLTLSHIQNIHWYCNHLISYSRVLHSFTIVLPYIRFETARSSRALGFQRLSKAPAAPDDRLRPHGDDDPGPIQKAPIEPLVNYWLVVWNMNFIFSPIVGMMIQSD